MKSLLALFPLAIPAAAMLAAHAPLAAGQVGQGAPGTAAPIEQQPPPEPKPAQGIVVTGERWPDTEINRYIYDMLRPAAVGQTGQYPRLAAPFCPSAIGFAQEVEAALEARMRLVASAAGIALAEEADCRPNMHLVRVVDGSETIRALRKRRVRGAFGAMPPPEITRLQRMEGPVFSWQQVVQNSRESGMVLGDSNAGVDPLNPFNINFVAPNCVNGRLCLPVQLVSRHSVVLVEDAALDDVSVTQLADFALMRGLIPAREEEHRARAREADTILNLFDETIAAEDRMPSLGRMDFAMLTALYAAPANVNANRQRGRMVAVFREALEALE
jgi:hypothetical protein